MTEDRVIIAPTVWVNRETGVQSTSQVYHYEFSHCVDQLDNPKVVSEETALLFGRRLCRTCELDRAKARAIEAANDSLALDELAGIAARMGEAFEIRVMWLAPDTKKKRVLWTSEEEDQ